MKINIAIQRHKTIGLTIRCTLHHEEQKIKPMAYSEVNSLTS